MTRFTASEARRQLSSLLDAVERGETVVLERHGVRFRLVLDPAAQPRRFESPLEIVDPKLLNGQWSWEQGESGELQLTVGEHKHDPARHQRGPLDTGRS